MMRFIDQKPVRARRSGPQRRDMWQELAEKRRSFRHGQSLSVHNHIRSELTQQLERLLDARRRGRVANGNRLLSSS